MAFRLPESKSHSIRAIARQHDLSLAAVLSEKNEPPFKACQEKDCAIPQQGQASRLPIPVGAGLAPAHVSSKRMECQRLTTRMHYHADSGRPQGPAPTEDLGRPQGPPLRKVKRDTVTPTALFRLFLLDS